jgi:YD repeat-containing protein
LTLNDAGDVLVEAYSGGGALGGISITNGYDALLRRTNIVTLSGGTVLIQVTNNYDSASRLLTVSDGTNSATYGYVVNSPLVGQICFKNNATLRMTTAKSYDNLNRLTSTVTSNAQSAILDLHSYTYNNANQRTGMTNADSSRWVYQYDSLGQVTNGTKSWSDGTLVAGQQFGYAFDTIGNRQSTTAGGDQSGANLRSASYTANNLYMYVFRTVPSAVDVLGSATNAATVTVNGQATYRKNDYYWLQLVISNSSGPVYQSVTDIASLSQGSYQVSSNTSD